MSQTPNVLDMMIGGAGVGDPRPDRDAARTQYDLAMEAEANADRPTAIEYLRKAVALDRANPQYPYQLAVLLDLVGEENEAVALYEQVCRHDPPPVNALINLATLYEDRGEISRAEKCLRQVLDTDPNHPRARMFMKDVCASRDMYYDEEHARDQAKHNALLDTPVTDFELTVRARNCLKKMNIRTLGDLLRITEAELMSYKNFGESSLVEIKHMLTAKGLRLGQGLEDQFNRMRSEVFDHLKGRATDEVLNKPISVLDLSVRARKALQMLNIQTISDLATRTEAELMGVKNFGQTSLDEVRIKLGEINLELRELS